MEYTTFDVAVLLEKAILLNGIIANSPDVKERRQAKAEFEKLKPQFMELAQVTPAPSNVCSFPF
ncbi:MAG: hypothetical protein KBT36_12925 [Kurthia sp.]|nr:hypothetical protein [Candidatus Kurthia equi]